MSTHWCQSCGYSLGPDVGRCPQCGAAAPLKPVTARELPGPYRAALPVLAGLTAVCAPAVPLLLWLGAAGRTASLLWPAAIVGAALGGTFGLLGGLIWALDWRQRRRGAAFLNSDRLLLRWTYGPEQWRAIRELAWQEQAGDWKVQLGCLTALFALVGVLTGGLIGLDTDWATALRDAAIGGGIVMLVGFCLGTAVAGGNYLSARRDLRRETPGWVGLAPGEFYAVDSYFRGDGARRAVCGATLQKGELPLLRLALKVPEGPRNPEPDAWDIVVPPHLVGAVADLLPQLPNDRSN